MRAGSVRRTEVGRRRPEGRHFGGEVWLSVTRFLIAAALVIVTVSLYVRQEDDRAANHRQQKSNFATCTTRNASTVANIVRERALAKLQTRAADPVLRAEAVLHTRSASELSSSLVDCSRAFHH